MTHRIEPGQWLKPELYDDPEIRGGEYNRVEAFTARPNYIRCAAILYKHRIWTGRRHCEIIKKIHEDEGGEKELYDKNGELICITCDSQGFMCDTGLFIRRQAAANLAVKSGQLPEDWSNRLVYSEDLW